jgi:hypothetical protein
LVKLRRTIHGIAEYQKPPPLADVLERSGDWALGARLALSLHKTETQGKNERRHQTLKNRVLLENYFLPGDPGDDPAGMVVVGKLRRQVQERDSRDRPRALSAIGRSFRATDSPIVT